MNKEKLMLHKTKLMFLAILLVRMTYLLFYNGPVLYADSGTYINYSFSPLLHLDFSQAGRTPIYPLIIKICQILFGDDVGLIAVTIFQMIVSYISVIFLYKTIRLFTNQDKIALIITFLYGASSMVFGWDDVILTESLALSGTVFFMYFTIQYMKSDYLLSGIAANILLLFLTFLRPSFLLYNMIFMVFLVIRLLLKRRNTWKIVLAGLVNWIIIFTYSALFYSAFEIFTISDPMPRQLMVICIERGYYKNYEDKEFVRMIDEGLEVENELPVWATMWQVLGHYGQKEAQNIAKECIKNNMGQYIQDEMRITCEVMAEDWKSYSKYKDEGRRILNVIDKIFNNIKVAHSIILGVVLLIDAIVELIKKKKIYWISGGLGAFIVAVFASSMIATCGEFMRTMICIVPMTYLALAYVISTCYFKEESFAVEDFKRIG